MKKGCGEELTVEERIEKVMDILRIGARRYALAQAEARQAGSRDQELGKAEKTP